MIGIIITMFVFTILCVGCQKKGLISQKPQEQKEDTSELILAFDSVRELTGTRIRLENQFGATEINTDKNYITEGTGSWLVKPQGNYENADAFPYVVFSCIDSTFQNSDFTKFDRLAMDVYNDSDEEITIRWDFTMQNDLEGISTTQPEDYVLSPRTWTTCEYFLTNEGFGTFFHHNDVKTMRVTFYDRKESKDDALNSLYLDNLRGYYTAEPKEITGLDFSLSEGLTFENTTDQYVFSTSDLNINRLALERIAYEDTMLENIDSSLGEHCLMGDATGATWPAFTLNFDKTYEKGQLLSYWVYIQVDEEAAKGANWYPEAFIHEYDRTYFQGIAGGGKFNQWVQVHSLITASASTTWTYFNFDANHTGQSWFGDDIPVTIYFDNFQITDYQEPCSVDANGKVTFKNPYNGGGFTYDVMKPTKKGQTLKFDIDFNMKDTVSIWVLGDGDLDGWATEWYAKRYEPWEGKQTIYVTAPQDTEYFRIYVAYQGESGDFKNYIATIDNIQVGGDTTTVKKDGTIILQSDFTGGNSVSHVFEKKVKKGQYIFLELDVTPAQGVSVWVLGCDLSTAWTNEWYAQEFTEWVQPIKLQIRAKEDIEKFSVLVRYNDDTQNHKATKVTISNVEVKTVELSENATITLPYNGSDMNYFICNKPVQKGDLISFNLDISPEQYVGMWVLGTEYPTWGSEWHACEYNPEWDIWPGDNPILVTAKEDVEAFTILIQYRDNTQNWQDNVITISNFNIIKGGGDLIEEEEGEEGKTIVLQNKVTGSDQVVYVCQEAVKEGEIIKFNLDVSPRQNVAMWIFGCDYNSDGWVNEWYARTIFFEYDEWPSDGSPVSVSLGAKKDTDVFSIVVRYYDNTQNFKENVVTISDFKVVKDDEDEVSEDGVIKLQTDNSGGNIVYYACNKSVKAGDEISFNFDISPEQYVAVWVLSGDYSKGWGAEWHAYEYNPEWVICQEITRLPSEHKEVQMVFRL